MDEILLVLILLIVALDWYEHSVIVRDWRIKRNRRK